MGCWLVFISFELTCLRFIQGYLDSPGNYLLYYLLNLSLFYGQLWIMSADLQLKRFILLIRITGLLLLLSISVLLKLLANRYLTPSEPSLAHQLTVWRTFVISAVSRSGYFMMLAGFYSAAGNLSTYARRLTDARNALLQQQLQPHLIFNALNFIYNQVYQQSAPAAHQVYLLSELMRFSLRQPADDGKIALHEELKQVEHLIEINRNRFQDALHLEVLVTNDHHDYRLIPLILLTLTENMFKHGDLTDKTQIASLTVTIDSERQLHYNTFNRKKFPGRQAAADSIGLQNIRLRLDTAYARRYRLNITDKNDTFAVNLTLPLWT